MLAKTFGPYLSQIRVVAQTGTCRLRSQIWVSYCFLDISPIHFLFFTINMGKTILFHIDIPLFTSFISPRFHPGIPATKPHQIEAYLRNSETCAAYLWINFHLVGICLSFLALTIFPNTFEKQKAIHAMSGVSFAPN